MPQGWEHWLARIVQQLMETCVVAHIALSCKRTLPILRMVLEQNKLVTSNKCPQN